MEGRLDLAVLESRWWKTSNDSVRGLFDMLAGMHKDNPFACHYEMFNNADSLKELIPRIAKVKDVHNIYIGAMALRMVVLFYVLAAGSVGRFLRTFCSP